MRGFVCLLFSLFFFIFVIVSLPVNSQKPPSWQENTQLREHVDAVVEQAEAGVDRSADGLQTVCRQSAEQTVCRCCIGHEMCMANDLVNSDHHSDSFRHYLLMRCVCRELKKIGSLKFDGETNGMRQWHGSPMKVCTPRGCLDT